MLIWFLRNYIAFFNSSDGTTHSSHRDIFFRITNHIPKYLVAVFSFNQVAIIAKRDTCVRIHDILVQTFFSVFGSYFRQIWPKINATVVYLVTRRANVGEYSFAITGVSLKPN